MEETKKYYILKSEKYRYGVLYFFTFEQDEEKRKAMQEKIENGEPVFEVYEYDCLFNEDCNVGTENFEAYVKTVVKEIEDNCDCWSEERAYLKNK